MSGKPEKKRKSFFLVARGLFESDLWMDIVACRLFILLFGKASHQDGMQVSGTTITLKRGQYLRSYEKLAEDLRFRDGRAIRQYSKHTIADAVARLERAERIAYRGTDWGTLFTILKYEDYQGFQGDENNDRGTGHEHIGERLGNNNNKAITMHKNKPLGSAKKAKPERGVKNQYSEESKRLIKVFQKHLQESGQTVFAKDWYLTSLSCCEPLLKQGKPPAEIEKVIEWAVRQWDCRATVTHFKHIVTAYPHYERSHAGTVKLTPKKQRWQLLTEADVIECIYPPHEKRCGLDYIHHFGTGLDAILVHKADLDDRIRAGDFKVLKDAHD